MNVNFPPRVTPIVIVTRYCENHNMSYMYQSENNRPWNHAFPDRKGTNVWILIIVKKEPTTVQQVLEAISIQQSTEKFNRVHVIISRRDKDIIRTNLQEKICIFNQIRHIQAIGNKLSSPPTTPPTPDHIEDVFNRPLRSEWYHSIFSNYEKMATSTTFSAPFLRSLLPPDAKILRPRIYVWVKKLTLTINMIYTQ